MKSRGILTLAIWLLIWPVAAAELPRSEPEQVGISAERLERIRSVLRDHVAEGRLAGAVALLARRGKVFFFESFGARSLHPETPMTNDTLFRIASMSKPITSVAVMMLYEQGRFLLDDPVSRYLPELGGLEVAVAPESANPAEGAFATAPAEREMTIQDLLRHTSGLTYGFFSDSSIDQRYRQAGILTGDATIAETVEKLGELPLKHQPGTTWEYSVSVDVLGRLVEAVSGLRFDRFLEDQLFAPLRMRDTGFHIAQADLPRLSTNYRWLEDRLRPTEPNAVEGYVEPTTHFSGGGGLVSTAADYFRFCQMLLNGGQLEGQRLLGRKTVELIRSDHLGDIALPRRPGYGFGLGFAVRTQPGLATIPGSVGEFNWGGAYGTTFWIDPQEEFIGVFMIQLRPSPRPYSREFKGLAYQAIAD